MSADPHDPATKQPLIRAVFAIMPRAPALVALARFTYAPGSFFGPAAGPGPVVFRMEAGQLSFRADGAVSLVHGSSGPTTAQHTMMPKSEFDVRPGDQLLVPGNTTHTARSSGTVQAAMMGLAVFPQVPPQQFPAGVQFIPLVMGMAEALPRSPAAVTLDRISCGVSPLMVHAPGPVLVHVEKGAMRATVDAGAALVIRAATAGPSDRPQPAPLGAEIALGQGDGLFFQRGAAASLRSAEESPATVVQATIAPEDATDKRALANRYFYESWNGGDLSVFDDIVATDFIDHNPLSGQHPGRKGLRQFITAWRAAFPDTSISVDLHAVEGQKVACRWSARGTHAAPFLGLQATGKPIDVSGITIFRIEDGVIREGWTYWDQATLLAQLGAVRWPGS